MRARHIVTSGTAIRITEERPTMFKWRAALAAVAAAFVATLLAPTVASAEPTIQSVTSSQQAGGEVVRIELSEPLASAPAGFVVQNPPRVAIDLPGVGNAMGRSSVEVNQGNVRSVNVAQAGDRTRLVLNLKQASNFRTQLQGKVLLVTLETTPGAAAAAGSDGGPVDFRSVVWPLIAKELTAAHYRRLVHAHPERVLGPWNEFRDLLDSASVTGDAFARAGVAVGENLGRGVERQSGGRTRDDACVDAVSGRGRRLTMSDDDASEESKNGKRKKGPGEDKIANLLRLPFWTEEHAEQILQAQKESGLPLGTFSRKYGITPSRMYKWERRLQTRPAQDEGVLPTPFVKVRVGEADEDSQVDQQRVGVAAGCLTVRMPSGVQVVIPKDAPESLISTVLWTLQARPC